MPPLKTPKETTPGPFAWPQPWAFADVAKTKTQASPFAPSSTAARAYHRKLLSVAKQVGGILGQSGGKLTAAQAHLEEYAKLIEPWAQQAAANMLAGVDRKNRQAWQRVMGHTGKNLKELLDAPGVGAAVKAQIEANTRLIKSIVEEPAQQIAKLVQQGMVSGARADELTSEISRIAGISKTRAKTIAYTETSKASTALTQARAKSVGSEGYIWRTARDGDTRDSHRAMEGKFVRWDSPPTLDGMTGHAGDFPWCRCYPEPVIKNDDGKVIASPLPVSEKTKTGYKPDNSILSQWEQNNKQVVPHSEGGSLPGIEHGHYNLDKLSKYALNANNPSGKHKARVFKAALGAGPEHSQLIMDQIKALAPHLPAVRGSTDKWGERFKMITPITGPNGKTVDVIVTWIYDRSGKNQKAAPKIATILVARK